VQTHADAATSVIPLFERFPALQSIPRAPLCLLPSPIERITGMPGADSLWVKRDDLNAPFCGGNKVRALEFLLGGVRPGDTVLTLGGAGSTHVLATVIHARRIGATTAVVRWRHDMNSMADAVSERIGSELDDRRIGATTLGAVLRTGYLRLTRTVHFIPVGGSTPLGALGHVNAGLELAAQIQAGAMPIPRRIVLPLGSGGTMAGLALGLSIAGLDIPIIGARVAPRLFANRSNVARLARGTARLIAGLTGGPLHKIRAGSLGVAHQAYGGAYGRPIAAGTDAASRLAEISNIRLDDTYSAKAFAVALECARAQEGPTLFWLTFDARWLTS
jgi:1-aminocyclopropane-1-carboxylate deaminase